MSMERFIQRKTRAVLWCGVVLALLGLTGRLAAQTGGSLNTVAGAFAGFANGFGNVTAQFDGPMGLALTKDKNILVADSANNMIRSIRASDQFVSTFIPQLNKVNHLQKPVAVAVDTNGVIYVANEITHDIQKYDRFGNFMAKVATTVSVPTALAIGQATNLYVAELNGIVTKYSPAGNLVTTYQYVNASAQFRGVAVMAEGKLAVSDAGNHVIWIFNQPGDAPILFGGTLNMPGFGNGLPGYGMLNQPCNIAAGPNNSLVIADRGNHRVRVLGCDGTLDTFYGVDPSLWEDFPGANLYPGWADGSVQYAESRDPVGLTVGEDGTVYGSEIYYHLVRAGTGFTYPTPCGGGGGPGGGGNGGGNTNGSGTNVVLQAPVLTPNSGYYPMGVKVVVSSPISSTGFGPDTTVYFTTDGTDPTTNSPVVPSIGGKRIVEWNLPLLDLTSLRVRFQSETNLSLVARGVPATFDSTPIQGEVGIAPGMNGTNFTAGLGSTLILPVVVNLRSNAVMRSLQMVVEISKVGTAARIESPLQPKALTMSSNDFVSMALASTNTPLTFLSNSGGTSRLAVVYIGTNQVFRVSPFGTVAVLSIPIPAQADSLGQKSTVGSQYLVHISQASGTSDGQTAVVLQSMPDRLITVVNKGYLVGDTAPGGWYNAGDFGSGLNDLPNNADVNNAFYASLGFKVPYASSDAFNAMDVVPEDSAFGVGGDGEIRFLDWQILLRRSLGFNTKLWKRTWTMDGVLKPYMGTISQPLDSVSQVTAKASPSGYHRTVQISADPFSHVQPDQLIEVPVRLRIKNGASLAGLQFVAYVTGDQGEPMVSLVNFRASSGVPAASPSGNSIPGLGPINNAIFCSWNVGALLAPLQGNVVLGYLVFRVPASALSGGRYQIHFEKADGASDDLVTMYDFESFRSDVWVGVGPLQPADPLPDEWKMYHFGSITGDEAQAGADPDHDGFNNYEEFTGSMDPVSSDWRVAVSESGARIRWFGRANSIYTIERSQDLKAWQQVGSAQIGQNQMLIYNDTSATGGNQYYRFQIR